MARTKKYKIKLTDDELKELKSVIRKNKTSKTIRCRYQIIIDLKRNVNSDNARRVLDGRAEARIIELACGPGAGRTFKVDHPAAGREIKNWAMQGNHCPCVRVTIRKQIRNMSVH